MGFVVVRRTAMDRGVVMQWTRSKPSKRRTQGLEVAVLGGQARLGDVVKLKMDNGKLTATSIKEST